MKIKGKYNKATVYAKTIDDTCIDAIKEICNQKGSEGEKIIVMPDCHSMNHGCIGLTMTTRNGINPYLVGSDISCGVAFAEVIQKDIDFEKLDKLLESPTILTKEEKDYAKFLFSNLSFEIQNKDYLIKTLGTVGGSNHFCSLEKDENEHLYILVHSGSRNLGAQVCRHYVKIAEKETNRSQEDIENIINNLKSQGKSKEIQTALEKFKHEHEKIPKWSCYLNKFLTENGTIHLNPNYMNYFNDLEICHKFAIFNREKIIQKTQIQTKDINHCVHNYVSGFLFKDGDDILRKGAISAHENELFVIPINMRDGSLLCKGKGNKKWNYSAPHGAGRILSRNAAKKIKWDKDMQNIWSKNRPSDENPYAYKNINEITSQISNTANIIAYLKPIYNYKEINCYKRN